MACPFPTSFKAIICVIKNGPMRPRKPLASVLDAVDAVRAKYPDTCDLFIGDFSRVGGGGISMHRSHQNGRDADLGMYAKGNRTLDTFVPMNEEILNAAKTWCFIESLLRSQHIQYIFLDRRIQNQLREAALSQGVDPTYLDSLFANSRGSVFQHVRGHYDHMHVRFFTPWSTMAARASDVDEQKRTEIETAQQAYLPQKGELQRKGYGKWPGRVGSSFGVDQKDLCRWNQMHVNDALNSGGLCGILQT